MKKILLTLIAIIFISIEITAVAGSVGRLNKAHSKKVISNKKSKQEVAKTKQTIEAPVQQEEITQTDDNVGYHPMKFGL